MWRGYARQAYTTSTSRARLHLCVTDMLRHPADASFIRQTSVYIYAYVYACEDRIRAKVRYMAESGITSPENPSHAFTFEHVVEGDAVLAALSHSAHWVKRFIRDDNPSRQYIQAHRL